MAFSIVLFSLVVQGLSIKPLIKWLGVTKKETGNEEYERLIAKGHEYETAINEIQKMKKKLFITEAVTKEMIKKYETSLETLRVEVEQLFKEYPELKTKQQSILKKYSLYAQYDAINQLVKDDIISNDVAEREHDLITNELVELEDEE